MTKTSTWMLAAALAIGLSACGGGGGGGGRDPGDPGGGGNANAVPESASRSVAGLMGYLGELVRSRSDSAEPLDLKGFDPQRSDDAEAQDLN